MSSNIVKLFDTFWASISVLRDVEVSSDIFISSSSRDTREIAHCVSIAPFILKNAEALNTSCLQASVLSGAFYRAVPSCGSIYRRGFGICESFHQPLNHGSANTKVCYKIRQRYQFHVKVE